jgi:hypothetical protein
MSFKEIVQNLGSGGRERKEKIKELDEDLRFQKLVEDRQKSANERELEKYMKDDREKAIKKELEWVRKKRNHEINYGHNPLKTKNITNHSDFEILKEKNIFPNKNMFAHQKRVF